MIEAFAVSCGAEVLAQFTQVESGCRADRQRLAAALQLAKATGSTLANLKLERLARIVAFLLALRDRGVRFVVVDMPVANDLIVGITALVAQAERSDLAADRGGAGCC